jgi:hypothetical protein
MNIYLVPYTWVRHVVVSLAVGGAALLAWWLTICWVVVLGPVLHRVGFYWWQSVDGLMFFCYVSSAISFTSVLAEGSLKRRSLIWRVLYAMVAGFVTLFTTLFLYSFWVAITPFLGSSAYREVLVDPALVSLRYRLPVWLLAGFSAGFGAFFARRGQTVAARFGYGLDTDVAAAAPSWGEFFYDLALHWLGSLVAVIFGAAVWHTLGFYKWAGGDLYLASAMGAFVWGTLFGLLIWAVPDDLYAGWVRVLSSDRFGTRVPVDRRDGQPSERFIGHFPRGLDLYLPLDEGVAELHASFVKTKDGRYTVRGLSIFPTIVKRFLERLDLRYDVRRPAPLETELNPEDRVILTDGRKEVLVEFILLPKEEQ